MTEDKLIIINDIDVSKCKFCIKTDKYRCGVRTRDINHLLCEENPNCKFKQLSRLNAQYNAVVEQNKGLQEEIIHYRRILGEIKEIAEVSNNAPCLEVDDCTECVDCDDPCTDNGATCMQYGLYKILQKCEVINSESKET